MATMIGPSTTPSNPNAAIPPSTLMKTSSPPISARPLISQGRMTLSTLLTITAQKSTSTIPRTRCPPAIRLIDTGTQISAEPTSGTKEKNPIITPQKIGALIPVSANASPPSAPCAAAATRLDVTLAKIKLARIAEHAVAMRQLERQQFAQPLDHRGAVAIEIEHRQYRDAEMEQEDGRVLENRAEPCGDEFGGQFTIAAQRSRKILGARLREALLNPGPQIVHPCEMAVRDLELDRLHGVHALPDKRSHHQQSGHDQNQCDAQRADDRGRDRAPAPRQPLVRRVGNHHQNRRPRERHQKRRENEIGQIHQQRHDAVEQRRAQPLLRTQLVRQSISLSKSRQGD